MYKMDTTREKKGRPNTCTTWQRTVKTELREMVLIWGEAGKVANDQDRWHRIVVALCLTGGEEDELIRT